MSRAKMERLINLTCALMATSRPLSVEEIGTLVEGYQPERPEPFRRMFERDKEELRDLGIPVQVEQAPDLTVGYRIRRSDYALPPLALDAEEAAALGLAARLWSSAALARAGESALRKITATGVDTPPPPDLAASIGSGDPALPALLTASVEAREITFPYRRPDQTSDEVRRVAPWGVVSRHGHWYLVGHDHDREAVRVFRLSRIRGPVEMGDTPHAFSRPEGVDLVGLVDDDDSTAPLSLAQLEVRPGAAHALRRDATAVDGDVLTVPYRDPRRFTDRLVGHGSDVTVLGPPELRDAVIARLRAVAGQ